MRLDLSGQTFGKWHVIERDSSNVSGNRKWVCACQCGAKKLVATNDLRNGQSKSCGCTRKNIGPEIVRGRRILYHKWSGMIKRCCNPQHSHYHRYGGRGITVCEEWRNDFPAFYSWSIANGFEIGLELDREENDEGYSAGNCRFVTRKIQLRNRAKSIKISYLGVIKPALDWAEELNINYERIRNMYNTSDPGTDIIGRCLLMQTGRYNRVPCTATDAETGEVKSFGSFPECAKELLAKRSAVQSACRHGHRLFGKYKIERQHEQNVA